MWTPKSGCGSSELSFPFNLHTPLSPEAATKDLSPPCQARVRAVDGLDSRAGVPRFLRPSCAGAGLSFPELGHFHGCSTQGGGCTPLNPQTRRAPVLLMFVPAGQHRRGNPPHASPASSEGGHLRTMGGWGSHSSRDNQVGHTTRGVGTARWARPLDLGFIEAQLQHLPRVTLGELLSLPGLWGPICEMVTVL